MAKVRACDVDKKERYRIIGELFELVVNLRTKQEVVVFLVGLFTRSEALMIARRIKIAKMLVNQEGYDAIRKKLKVSYQTVATVERWLQREEKRDLIVKKIKELDKGSKAYKKSGSLLDRYAQHRILNDLFD